MEHNNWVLEVLLFGIIGAFIIAAVLIDGSTAFSSFAALQLHPARLINDFIEIGGIGATLVNSALVGAIGLALILLSKVQLSGPTFAGVFTIMGFGFFGKTPLNILPIIAGVYISARLVGKSFSEYLLIALFGTALGPLTSAIAWELGLPVAAAIPVSIGAAVLTGFFLPAIAVAMLHLHQGYNLYNVGLSCGFFGLFAAALIRISGNSFESQLQWFEGDSLFLTLIVPVIALIMIFSGLLLGKKRSLRSLVNIQKYSGRLPTDFIDMESVEAAFINSGLLGLAASLYIIFIGGDFSGPVLGSLFTIMGFGAFGTHLKNSWPVVSGVVASSLIFGKSLSSPGPILAAVFSTTLAPLAGQFGVIAGFSAGFLHLVMVLNTGPWHGGMNLYNNGFAGGLTATLVVSLIQWYQSNKTDQMPK